MRVNNAHAQAPTYGPYEEPPEPFEGDLDSAEDSGTESDELMNVELGQQFSEFGDEERPTTRAR